ncbi:MAG: DUF1080 domain-containing protein, partial [Burkholderiales bacterium]
MSLDGPRLAPLSGSKATALVILIHGYGSNGDDLISLARMIQPALPNAAFVAPNAPSRMGGMAAAYQWWPIETFSMAERAAGAAAAAPALDTFITHAREEAGLPSDRVLLIGFSQGTMMALHVGLRRMESIAGIVGISGMLVAPEHLEADIKIEDAEGNSGIQTRSHFDATANKGNGRVYGRQCELDPTARKWTGGIYDEGRREWLYPMSLHANANNNIKANEYNHLTIECIGNEMKTWVNGEAAAYLVDTITEKGFVALQVHAIK